MYSTFPVSHTSMGPSAHTYAPVSHTQQPLVTGTSVLGLKYKDGVMLAADNLASYGSLARFRDIQRLHPLGTHTILGAAGDMSDFQWLKKELDALLREEETLKLTDGHPALSPKNLYTFLANLFYSRRSRINPLWNACLVGGWDFDKDEPYVPPKTVLMQIPRIRRPPRHDVHGADTGNGLWDAPRAAAAARKV